jgi:hypothetical protein
VFFSLSDAPKVPKSVSGSTAGYKTGGSFEDQLGQPQQHGRRSPKTPLQKPKVARRMSDADIGGGPPSPTARFEFSELGPVALDPPVKLTVPSPAAEQPHLFAVPGQLGLTFGVNPGLVAKVPIAVSGSGRSLVSMFRRESSVRSGNQIKPPVGPGKSSTRSLSPSNLSDASGSSKKRDVENAKRDRDEAKHDRQLRRNAERLRESPVHPKNLHGRDMEEKTISDSDAVVAPGEDLIASEVLHRRSDSVDTPRRRLEHDESSDSDADNEVAGMFDVTENKP